MKSKPLGKGLQALFEDTNLSNYIDSEKKFLDLPVNAVVPNPLQPREKIDEEQIESLKNSIQHSGLIQPIAVRLVENRYEIVAGERRWRAVKALNLTTIPAYVLKVEDDKKLLELSLLENVKRENLNPIEVAVGFKKLSDDFNMTQQQISETFAVDRSTVANSIRLLKLPDDIQEKVKTGDLTMGHARALLALESPDEQRTMSNRIIRDQMNVRQVEALLQKPSRKIGNQPVKPTKKSAAIIHLEDKLRYVLGSQVRIKSHKEGGKIEVDFYSLEDLDRLIELFSVIEKNIDFHHKKH